MKHTLLGKVKDVYATLFETTQAAFHLCRTEKMERVVANNFPTWNDATWKERRFIV